MSCGHYLRQEMFITCGPIGNTAITLPLPKSNHLKYYKIVLKNIMFIGWETSLNKLKTFSAG